MLLVIISLLIIFSTSSLKTQNPAIYVAESRAFQHNPEDPVHLSVADGYVVIRLWISVSLEVSKATLNIEESRINMKMQFRLTDYSVWFGYVEYDGSSFEYYFEVTFRNGTSVNVFNDRNQPFFKFAGVDIYPQVKWVGSRVGYQIFPERFNNGDSSNDHYGLIYDSLNYDNTTTAKPVKSNWSDPPRELLMHCCHQYYGGDLKGVIAKLDYLKELGVGFIYFNPIFLSGSVHGYDTYDHFKIHPMLGTLEDVQKLIEEAHKRDIKVIFDFVPGHVGLGFWAFQDVYVNGPNSRYWNWFTVYRYPFTPGNGNDYKCWEGVGSLPQLNVTNPEVRKYLLNAVIYWFEIGFDGVRIDTPLYLPENVRESFFREMRALIKSRFPDAYIVGEIWFQAPDWVNRGPFDSLMNYALGMGILLEYAQGKLNGVGPDHVSGRLAIYFSRYSVSVAGMGFNNVGTHDTDRTLTMLGGGGLWDSPGEEAILRLKMLSTLQYVMPGAPVVFQGDERGYTGRAGPRGPDEHRYPIQWDRVNNDVFNHYKSLGSIKNSLKPLHTSMIRILESRGSILAFTRGYNDEVLVVSNNDRVSATYSLPQGKWHIIFVSSGQNVEVNTGAIVIPPLTTIILVSEDYRDEATVTVEKPFNTSPITTTTTSYFTTTTESVKTPSNSFYSQNESRKSTEITDSSSNLSIIVAVAVFAVIAILLSQILLRRVKTRV